MTIEQVNNLSLPMLNKLIEHLPKRMCERLGIPYSNDEDENKKEVPNTKINEEPKYPSRKVEKLMPTKKTAVESGIYDAQNKRQVLDFFAGWADVEDTTI